MGIRRTERAAGRGGGFTLGLAAIGLTALFLLAGNIVGDLLLRAVDPRAAA